MSLLRLRSSLLTSAPSLRAGARLLSTRASRVLSALSLPTDEPIPGVFDGQWGGSGVEVETKCPATGEVLGRIKTVSPLSLMYISWH